ncbi:uncharacterized protein LOC5520998 isoform X1 [Nematostella vectensis]|uniref:uncharacterized protein LOC5520998 isoform X1 n=1 Tax=Nematostella vectensis TaxID=45351 RepID=UPI00139022FB|nr:uncharacterized protein LOC5520998 isoform X1 [Nematostella vectensis]XP_048583274.1 uncharacterized protein LOC5520998 isoform X2 [Nematostella vectensis]XP_048583276.1 uncharacterized protein LOC5520998 isoform X1 [Nematostella vectensis]
MPRKGKRKSFRGRPAWEKAKDSPEMISNASEDCAEAGQDGGLSEHEDAVLPSSSKQDTGSSSSRPVGSSEEETPEEEEVFTASERKLASSATTSNRSKPYTEDPDPGYRFILGMLSHAMDINRRLVYAAAETGIGREGMATICEILNMPQPMSSQAWKDHQNTLYSAHKKAVSEHLESSRARLRQKLSGDLSATDDDQVFDIVVTYDGTWSKRGHTANFGFGFVMSVDTGEVLDYGFKSKICWECNNQAYDRASEEYHNWYKGHKETCSETFEGSSGNMEVEIAKDLWARSTDFGLRYKYMVCDGDSRAYNAVWDTYGSCDKCKLYENIARQSKQYKNWLLTEDHTE